MLRFASGNRDDQGASADDDVGLTGRVLVVDDDRLARTAHRSLLAQRFDVLTAESGEEAIALCKAQLPDLVVLDVGMPGLDGYETCRHLREWTSIPILFVTAHQSLEEHLKAYDAGGSDLITKPVNGDIFLRKVSVAIRQYRAAVTLAEEKEALQRMAMGFLSNASQNGILLNFMRSSIVCQDHRSLAGQLLAATRDLGLSCCVLIQHDGGATAITERGEPSPLEWSILEHASEMGRLFQFKHRLVVNYERVSVIVADMPDEAEQAERAGIVRDSLVILAETAEALAINVDIRQEGQKRAEQLQLALSGAEKALTTLGEKNRAMLLDTHVLLQELVDGIERTYSWLGTSQEQEATISTTMDRAVQRVLDRLSSGSDFDAQFAEVMQALNAGRGKTEEKLF